MGDVHQECLGPRLPVVRDRCAAVQGIQLVETGGYVRIGDNDQVIVQVVCVPIADQRTAVTVSAFSTDSKTAELARNTVREYIIKVVRID
jgi:hypothetical protein